MRDVIKSINKLSDVPASSLDFAAWIEGSDAIEFLERNLRDDELAIAIHSKYAYVHTVMVDQSLADPIPVKDCLAWNFSAWSTWDVSVRSTDPPEIKIEPPLLDTGSKLFDRAEQFIFSRNFEGRRDASHYYEVSQKFLHVMELHHVPERNAWCQLDENGDIQDVIRIVNLPSPHKDWKAEAILIDRDVFDRYLALGQMSAVRTFDFTRFPASGFRGWNHQIDEIIVANEAMAYHSHVQQSDASYLRGAQVISPRESREVLRNREGSFGRKNEKYASFIIYDWRHESVVETSCAPGATANYFVESDLPFELSPAFFRPEVLAKYKADTEKYRIEDRSIYCRGAWSIRGFDINNAGQIHAYVVDLRNLPYQEQLYWKAHNENPKGSISSRAFLADFEGSWEQGYHPLNELKNKLRNMSGRVEWWDLKDPQLIEKVNYPVSTSPDEFANEIMNLDKLLIEGMNERFLKESLRIANVAIDKTWRSLMLLEEVLVLLGKIRDDVRTLLAPFRQVHHLRSKLKGHVSGSEAREIQKQIIDNHGTYREAFQQLCAQCDRSLGELTAALHQQSSQG